MAADISQPGLCRNTRLAAIEHAGNEQVDRLLHNIVRQLKQKGFQVGGTIRSNERQPDAHRCDMVLEELTTGERISIYQQLGSCSKGCRLDTPALEQVVGLVDSSLDQGNLDILIINKFGKREADGNGFSSTIARAFASNIPVLVTLNQDYAEQWNHFCAGEGQILTPDRSAISQWIRQHFPAALFS